MPEGITSVIAVILLLLITITMVGFSFVFFQRTTESTGQKTEENLQQQIKQTETRFAVVNVNENKVYIRNLGSSELKDMVFFVNNVRIDSDNPTIAPNTTGIFTLDSVQLAAAGSGKLKVISGSGFADEVLIKLDIKTCSQQGGTICSSSQYCSGTILPASDTNNCCTVACLPCDADG